MDEDRSRTVSARPPLVRLLLRRTLVGFLVLVVLVGSAVGLGWWYCHPPVEHRTGVVYGKRGEKDLTLDVLTPERANGCGVLFLVSGSWKSRRSSIRPWIVAPLLRRGYTVFPVCHISQPEASVAEIVEDIHRSVRFIRHHAYEFGVHPDRLGISGGSSGGHLSLMIATRGGAGDVSAKDPVDRESSKVQAAAVFFPVTDLLNLGESTQNPGDGGPPIDFVRAFGPGADHLPTWKKLGREVSPIDHIHRDVAPVFIMHGDVDTLVPLDQSTRFIEKAKRMGVEHVNLVIRQNKSHGWVSMVWDLHQFADWYDRWLQR